MEAPEGEPGRSNVPVSSSLVAQVSPVWWVIGLRNMLYSLVAILLSEIAVPLGVPRGHTEFVMDVA